LYKIGDQKIGIITTKDGKEAIFRLAMTEGNELGKETGHCAIGRIIAYYRQLRRDR